MVSRRDFMKGLGLLGAGLGAAASAAPAFHDLDEVLSAPSANLKRPWYVKERDFYNPTLEIDWDMQKRYDARLTGQTGYVQAQYYGKARTVAATSVGNEAVKQHIAANDLGYGLKTLAIGQSLTKPDVVRTWTGPVQAQTNLFMPSKAKTPAERGVPKWTGTPEEANKMLNVAMRMFGGALFAYGDLDDRMRNKVVHLYQRGDANNNKFIDSWPPPAADSPPFVYEDVPEGYDSGGTNRKLVIPSKPMYWICFSLPGARHQYQNAPSMNSQGRWSHDALRCIFYPSLYNFLRSLGYQMLGFVMSDGVDPLPHGATTILGGIGERSRQDVLSFSPEYGLAHSMWSVLTDLPVAPTKPIDAGMWRFCKTCTKCADVCPVSAISKEKETSWELPLIEGKPNLLHNPGTKSLWTNGASCRIYINEAGHGCKQCIGNCTFTVGTGAMAHEVVKGTIANISVFNSFFFSLANSFDYGIRNPEDFWDMDLPVLGYDMKVGSPV
ncbi:reductive dehalogenase [Dehalogenimonas etheniformans]|uniref:Reductive dehalogenase n=2 Tax=Dehalogenimonas etheniformans TaxID=1536648 RepID=A0A2P5P7K8_9CHLR|nr:reductive dehalogenase [Dehalogenimonas etheniformans]PPD58288.1 reductive dehalogenase [Dehalogenimonas etheniformans]